MTIKRTMMALTLVVVLAVTGCAGEKAGVAVPAQGVAAVAVPHSSTGAGTGVEGTTDEGSTQQSTPAGPPTSVADPSPSPPPESSTDEGGQPGSDRTVRVSPSTEEQSTEKQTTAETTEQKSTSDVPEGGGTPADMCSLVPAQYSKGLTKDDSRDPKVTCTYLNDKGGYQSASITTGFNPDDAPIKQDYNYDVKELKIDGRPGYTYFYGKDRTLAVATFVLADPRSGLQCQIQDDSMKPAQLVETVTALCTAASKKLPRG